MSSFGKPFGRFTWDGHSVNSRPISQICPFIGKIASPDAGTDAWKAGSAEAVGENKIKRRAKNNEKPLEESFLDRMKILLCVWILLKPSRIRLAAMLDF